MTAKHLTVLYDGGCPLCSREIRHYRGLDREQRIRWRDVAQEESAAAEFDISRDQAMAIFHVIDAQGHVFRGAAAFVRLWSEIPRYRPVSRLVHSLRLLPMLEWMYQCFARWHFQKRCREGACNASSLSSTH